VKAFIFPGQGSQKKGMGKDLFQNYQDHVVIANDILNYSIEKLCLENPNNQLNNTEFTQVGVYVVNALSYLEHLKRTKTEPDFVAGHSLGEYNALVAAKVIDFETGLKLVQMRGMLMQRSVNGAMAVVFGLSAKKVKEICSQYPELNLSIASYNTNTQTVIAGEKENIFKSEKIFTCVQNVKFLILNVSGAFHSPYMEAAKIEFKKYLLNFRFNKPRIPIISNVTASKYEKKRISYYLIEHIVSPVQWNNTIKHLLEQNVREFVEIGVSGNSLTKMVEDVKKYYFQKLRDCN